MVSALVQEKFAKGKVTNDTLITGDDLFAMGDIGPCELVKGRIVRMSTTGGEHALLEAEITFHLKDFNRKTHSGWVLSGEAGVYTQRNPDTVRGMDAAFISKERHPARPKKYLEVAPELVVEIVSPNDRWKEIQDKLQEYFAIGVETVWLVEPEERVVYVYTELTELTRLTLEDTLHGEGVLTGFELPLRMLFAESEATA